MSRRPMVSGRYLNALRDYAATRNVPWPLRPDMTTASTLTAFKDMESFPCSEFVALLEMLAVTSADTSFGLHFVEFLEPRPDGTFRHIIANCRTLRDAFLTMARFLDSVTDAFRIRYEEDERAGWMIFEFPVALGECNHFIAGQLALVALRARQLQGSGCMPLQVDIGHPEPSSDREFRRIFGQRLAFSRPVNRIGYSLDIMSQSLLTPRLSRARLQRDAAGKVAVRRGESLLSHSVANFISSALQRCEATEENVCLSLGRSRRTLQRQLASEGTSFKQLLEETRARLARHYLLDTDLSLTAIAFLLGYSEMSAFSRAAKSLLGATPSAIRKQYKTPEHKQIA